MTNNSHQIPAFLIAAPKSNSGKTLITLGLIHALSKRKMRVQPFKCGPDYIDPMFHSQVARVPSYNLDVWMASPDHVTSLFHQQASSADVAVVEGAMGLFDGANRDEGSAADVARLLKLPVVLVIDASAMAYSVAPLLYGFANFDKSLRIAGVIFNKVSGASHYAFLKQAAEDVGILSLGYLPKDPRLAIESRHLGLVLPSDDVPQLVSTAAELIEQNIDLEALLERTSTQIISTMVKPLSTLNLRIAVAKDAAFNFSYKANIDRLNELGSVTYFSPLTDTVLPDADLVWLPGGYPEIYLDELSKNESMLASIRQYVDSGKALIAECGGMMYLGNTIVDKRGKSYKMASVLDFSTTLETMKLHLGYRRILDENNVFNGHEFHYSQFKELLQERSCIVAYSARNKEVDMPIFRVGNVWASFVHLYLGEPVKASAFIKMLGL